MKIRICIPDFHGSQTTISPRTIRRLKKWENVSSIKRGLEEAIVHSKGEQNEVRLFTPEPLDVKKVREKQA